MSFTGNEEHEISFQEAGAMTAAFRSKNNGGPIGGFIGKKALSDLLEQENCVGIRIYFAIDGSEELTLVFVGADTDENDLVGGSDLCMNSILKCPSRCSEPNQLNSNT